MYLEEVVIFTVPQLRQRSHVVCFDVENVGFILLEGCPTSVILWQDKISINKQREAVVH